jgi:hypothetical protein
VVASTSFGIGIVLLPYFLDRWLAGLTLTRLASLGTLSRGAGEGLQMFTSSKSLSRITGEGGPSAKRWVGEGLSLTPPADKLLSQRR